MNITWVSSEAVPYAKTGGLADVSASLPLALSRIGHNVSVIMPFYPQVMGDLCTQCDSCYDMLNVPLGTTVEHASVLKIVRNNNLTFYFIEFNRFFDRPFLYDYYGKEYDDNADRFVFFSRAAMELIGVLGLNPDILHTNDWHSSLCNLYLKSSLYTDLPHFSNTSSVLTIHNIGYQGVFDKDKFYLTGLDWENFNHTCIEYHDQVNFLKAGIMTSDMVTTVSPSYAWEILTPDFAFTLEDALRHIHDEGRLTGILNGIDIDEWNPETDTLIPANYGVSDLSGKAVCKESLQERMGLEINSDIPLIGLVSRFAHQKGIDVLSHVVEGLLHNSEFVQFVILGSGDSDLENFFSDLAGRYPGKVGTYIGYSNELAHIIEAGADLFMMPSRYEPCGLNQMYSMRYGTVPVVRATGGLADTVVNYSETGIDESTGFSFSILNHDALYNTIRWALSVYTAKPANFHKLRLNGMKKDFSWKLTAQEYLAVYNKLAAQ